MSKWRRPATKTYDYNYRLGEHYYKPQLDYLETRKGRAKTPPPARTFAERFAEDPIYGHYGGLNLRRSGHPSDGLGESDIPTMSRFASMDDMNLGNKRRPLFTDTDLDSPFSPNSSRLVVGDRLLDSVGIKESHLSQPFGLTSSLSSSSKLQQQSSDLDQSSSFGRRKVGFIQSAGADMVSEDPFKSRLSSKFDAARKQADEMMSDMNQDAESSVSRFRARVQARKEENRRDQMANNFGFGNEDEDMDAIRTRVNKIGERAKARLAQLDDDYPDLQIGSSLASRRAGNTSSFADEEDDRMASRTLKISKRSVKSSYDME